MTEKKITLIINTSPVHVSTALTVVTAPPNVTVAATKPGPKGEQGEVGPTGMQGIQGPQGNTGPQGIQGEVGPTGMQGIQGPQGPQGVQGETGPTGLTGPKGDKGDNGEVGATGLQGPQGLKGDKGDNGEVGATGPAGPTDYNLITNKPDIFTKAESRLYVQSRGQNLVTNGFGLLETNYNFASFTFDPKELYAGAGSFLMTTRSMVFNDEFMAIDPNRFYRYTLFGKKGNADGSQIDDPARQFGGVMCYDVDKHLIDFRNTKPFGAVDTRLARELKPGDTTIELVDGTGWYNAGNSYQRHIAFYGYTNSKGYRYPDWEYTRLNSAWYGTGGCWLQGGISGNIITLRVPWPVGHPTYPVGTAVRNINNDGGYNYSIFSNNAFTTSWQKFETTVGGVGLGGIVGATQFYPGTAFVKLFWLVNWYNIAPNAIRFSGISFSELPDGGLTTTFKDQLGRTVTVKNGIITSIV